MVNNGKWRFNSYSKCWFKFELHEHLTLSHFRNYDPNVIPQQLCLKQISASCTSMYYELLNGAGLRIRSVAIGN